MRKEYVKNMWNIQNGAEIVIIIQQVKKKEFLFKFWLRVDIWNHRNFCNLIMILFVVLSTKYCNKHYTPSVIFLHVVRILYIFTTSNFS